MDIDTRLNFLFLMDIVLELVKGLFFYYISCFILQFLFMKEILRGLHPLFCNDECFHIQYHCFVTLMLISFIHYKEILIIRIARVTCWWFSPPTFLVLYWRSRSRIIWCLFIHLFFKGNTLWSIGFILSFIGREMH